MAYMGTPVGSERESENPNWGPGTGSPGTGSPETGSPAAAEQEQGRRDEALQLHQRLKAAVRAERQAVREVALCLREMERTRGFQELGYAGLSEYGEQAFGFAWGKTGQLARLGRRLAKLPRLDRALATGVLGWTKARTVAQVATPETEEAWIAVAIAESSRELEQLAFHARPGDPPRDLREDVDPPRYVWARFRMEMDHYELLMRALTQVRHGFGDVDLSASQLLLELAERELARREEAESDTDSPEHAEHVFAGEPLQNGETGDRKRGDGGRTAPSPPPAPEGGRGGEGGGEGWAEAGGENAYRVNYRIIAHRCPACESVWAETRGGRFELTRESRERVECDCEEVAGDESAGKPGYVTRSIPPATRRAVLVRDGGHCQVPGCRHHRYLDLHHILPRSRGGGHAPTNLVTVCSTHHELLHRDVVQVTQEADGSLTWDRGGGEPLGIVLALDSDRSEIGHDYLSEFDGPAGTWCLIETPQEPEHAEHVFGKGDGPASTGCLDGEAKPKLSGEEVAAAARERDAKSEHVFGAGVRRGPTRFPRGQASFLIGDEERIATWDLYRPLPTRVG